MFLRVKETHYKIQTGRLKLNVSERNKKQS